MVVTISRPPLTLNCPQRVTSVGRGSEYHTAMNCIVLFVNSVLPGQSLQSVLVYNFTNKKTMPHRSDIVASSCRVNGIEPAHCFTVSLISVVFRVGLPSVQFPTPIMDSKCLNSPLLMVMICSKSERFCIRHLSDLPLQIIINAWWASMNVGSKWPIG
jgi:hypothetical protein